MAGLAEPINEEKFDNLIEQFYQLGLDDEIENQTSTKGLIHIIEKHHLEHDPRFDFPEGNWNNFKTALLNGKYDLDMNDIKDEHSTELQHSFEDFVQAHLKGETTGNIDIPQDEWKRIKQEVINESSSK